MKKKIVIVGATSLIAEHCARLWVAERLEQLVLIVRDLRGLERLSCDLKRRAPKVIIEVKVSDLLDTKSIKSSVDDICATGLPDIVLIAHGISPDQGDCQVNVSMV